MHIERFITNKNYPLVKEGSVGIDFLTEKKTGTVQINMAPFKRQKVKAIEVDLKSIPECGLTARGVKLTTKAAQGVELLPEKEKPARASKGKK